MENNEKDNVISEKRLRDEIKKWADKRYKDIRQNGEIVIVEDDYRKIVLEMDTDKYDYGYMGFFVKSEQKSTEAIFRTRIMQVDNVGLEFVSEMLGIAYANLMAYLEINNFEIGE